MASETTQLEKIELGRKATAIWAQYRRGHDLTDEDMSVLRQAYYMSVLPRDPDFSVYEWVERGFPQIFF